MKPVLAKKLRSDEDPYVSNGVQTFGFADVDVPSYFGMGVPPRVGPVAPSHGGSLRRQLAAQWLHFARRSLVSGAWDYGLHAGDVHGDGLDYPCDEAERRVAGSVDFLCRTGILLVRQSFDRQLQFERAAGPFRINGPTKSSQL